MNFKKPVIFFFLFSLLYINASAQQKPDWVDNNGISIQYPNSVYITGFGIGEDESPSDRRSLAEQYALSDISSRFIVKIQSELQSILQNSEKAGFYSDVRSSVSTETQLKMFNVDVNHYDDRRHKRSYALAVMEIEPAVINYSSHLKELLEKISGYVKAAETSEQIGDIKQAVANYRKTFPLFIEYGETRTIILLLQSRSLSELTDETLSGLPVTSTEVETRINKVMSEIASVRAAAVSLADQLNAQTDRKLCIEVFPLTYRDTDFSSEFSSYFLPLLETELTPYFTVVSRNTSRSNVSQASNVLAGTYWAEGEGNDVRVLTYITDIRTGSKNAAATVTIKRDVVEKEGIELLPLNFKQAMEDSRIFLAKDVIPGTLSLEVWTSKGSKKLIYKENEETEIFVRTNKSCYLQVLYHMANGVRLLLYNNYYLGISTANQVVTLPDTFYFAPPLGVERLQVFANTGKFGKVDVAESVFDGEKYDNVLAEDFAVHTRGIRGIKKKEPKMEIAEKIITITTLN